jgi:hypothetical protein
LGIQISFFMLVSPLSSTWQGHSPTIIVALCRVNGSPFNTIMPKLMRGIKPLIGPHNVVLSAAKHLFEHHHAVAFAAIESPQPIAHLGQRGRLAWSARASLNA